VASTLKLDKSQINLRISYGSDRKKLSRIKGRWPGSGQPSKYIFPQGTLNMSSTKDIFSAAFKADEEIYLREIEMTIKVQNPKRTKIYFNGCFPGSPGMSISDGQSIIRLKRNRKMRQYIRFVKKGSSFKIIWEFNCIIPESESLPMDPILLTQMSGGLQPGISKIEHRIPPGTAETMWIAPQEAQRGIRVKDLEENLSWMEQERFFFNIIRLEKVHIKAGDWDSLHTDYRGKIGFINRRIEHNGMIPALSFEPAYVECDSELVHLHPEWLVGDLKGDALTLTLNRQRKVHILDFTQNSVKDYLEESINIFKKQWGFRSFHLQGLSALLLPGHHSDKSSEAGKILYSALEFFRSILGKDCFISAEDIPLITEVNQLDMITIPAQLTTERKSKKEIPNALYRVLEISSLSHYPWLLNAGSYPLPKAENCYHKQAGESFRQMLLIGGGMLSLNVNLPDISEKQREELDSLIPSFRKFSRGELQQLNCPKKNESTILFNSAGYLGVFNLSSKKQQLILNMESLKQEIYNKTGESPIQEGRTGMKTGELELILPPLGSRIFKF
jgi:Melibiase